MDSSRSCTHSELLHAYSIRRGPSGRRQRAAAVLVSASASGVCVAAQDSAFAPGMIDVKKENAGDWMGSHVFLKHDYSRSFDVPGAKEASLSIRTGHVACQRNNYEKPIEIK